MSTYELELDNYSFTQVKVAKESKIKRLHLKEPKSISHTHNGSNKYQNYISKLSQTSTEIGIRQ